MAIDISQKDVTQRIAVAQGTLTLSLPTLHLIQKKQIKKGDPYENAKLAAIHAVKQTPNMVFMTHPIPIEHINVEFGVKELTQENQGQIIMKVLVKTLAKTGCEIEALAGVLNGLLGILDLVKMYEKDSSGNYPNTFISDVHVVTKKKIPVKTTF